MCLISQISCNGHSKSSIESRIPQPSLSYPQRLIHWADTGLSAAAVEWRALGPCPTTTGSSHTVYRSTYWPITAYNLSRSSLQQLKLVWELCTRRWPPITLRPTSELKCSTEQSLHASGATLQSIRHTVIIACNCWHMHTAHRYANWLAQHRSIWYCLLRCIFPKHQTRQRYSRCHKAPSTGANLP